MKGVSVKYPKVDPGTARLTNIEGRINQCRTQHQQTEPLRYESDELLALTAFAVVVLGVSVRRFRKTI